MATSFIPILNQQNFPRRVSADQELWDQFLFLIYLMGWFTPGFSLLHRQDLTRIFDKV